MVGQRATGLGGFWAHRDGTAMNSPLKSAPDATHAIAIVGGGIAGLALALGLHRHGIGCRIYEAAPQIAERNGSQIRASQNSICLDGCLVWF